MSILLFLHLSGLSLWWGSVVLLTILFASLRKYLKREGGSSLLLLCTKIVNRMLGAAALVVLISGAGLIEQLGYRSMEKPFWIMFMEQAGGTVILLFVAVFTWKGRNVVKKWTRGAEQESGQASKVAGWYATALGVFAVAITSVLLVVSLRLV